MSVRPGSVEARVYAWLDEEEGMDRVDLAIATGLSRASVSGALRRLSRKGLATCGRWRETFVWVRDDRLGRAEARAESRGAADHQRCAEEGGGEEGERHAVHGLVIGRGRGS